VVGGAREVMEPRRMPLAEREPSKIRCRLADFYDATIDTAIPETPGRQRPQPGGSTGIIKQTKRVDCGNRNMINYHPTAELSRVSRSYPTTCSTSMVAGLSSGRADGVGAHPPHIGLIAKNA
jgi:hypothetical protein